MAEPLTDAESRLRAWVRDFGHDHAQPFVADVTAVLAALAEARLVADSLRRELDAKE